ncbi:hypothetical protein NM208_g11629 [Fusarium decemcellulare]|uniref:Uncharacterized protein n=1 Tax=Fusarium decemcellulare TaxID=57161 RepID=A0ACC1RUQ2_9HYPO|nr:hypothetical protein NM208_g11629 [Fusarium decemcellulare]
MIDELWRPPPRKEPGVYWHVTDRKLPEYFKYYCNWGFTIYRTHYSHESHEHWGMLLDALKRQTYLALGYLDDEELYKEDVERNGRGYKFFYKTQAEYRIDLNRLKQLFHLDPREDPALLGGLDIPQLRKVCLNEHPGAQRTMAGAMFCFALVADEAVLKDIAKGEFVVKVVAYDWKEGGDYFGWMRIPTGYLLELWHSLMMTIDHPHRVLRFDGPEEDLHEHIWPGDPAANPSGNCSEIRPGFFHYSAQEPMFSVEKKNK